jgi:hypothetical protein
MTTKSSPSPDAGLQQLTARALSPLSRYGHVALLLAAALMSVLLAALLATEPAIPLRTRVALGVMLAIGISWVGYAAWVLTQRRPLMAMHRVIAGWMAVAFTGVFVGGAIVMALSTQQTIYATAAVSGCSLFVLAIAALGRSYRRVTALKGRKRELEASLGH